ncbi:MAG TPA: Tim44-like domain-containing protein [Blastocatellia bacterium]|nr:Tim44-like domain-containing protein [Blastocatellia bacterium]
MRMRVFGDLLPLLLLMLATSLWVAVPANARPGGGQTHSSSSRSSGRSSSGSSSGLTSGSSGSSRSSTPSGGTAGSTVPSSTGSSGRGGSSLLGGGIAILGFLFMLAFIIIVVVVAMKIKGSGTPPPPAPERGANLQAEMDALKQADPNFSKVLYVDFVNTLYARAQEARGKGTVDVLSPYIDESSMGQISALGDAKSGLTEVTGVVLGSSEIVDVVNTPQGTTIKVFFEANYTETAAGGQQTSYYTEERWQFWREAGVQSLPPGKIDAIHCPKCGGPLERNADGSCAYCNTIVRGGQFHWFVTGLEILDRAQRGPQLTEETPEEGTDLPTVYQPEFQEARTAFESSNPGFSWERMNERANYIFYMISQAWTTLEWEKARPFETDNIFQMHRYWIEAYTRQRLRNVLDQIKVTRIEWVKIEQDAYYDALTARIAASELDYTVDAAGKVVCGSPTKPRDFTEYWTFIKTRGGKPVEQRDDHCPNCGAPLSVNMAGTCDFCGGKITSGDFDWVLSRIEQDESYTG